MSEHLCSDFLVLPLSFTNGPVKQKRIKILNVYHAKNAINCNCIVPLALKQS